MLAKSYALSIVCALFVFTACLEKSSTSKNSPVLGIIQQLIKELF